ncbi:UDP-N-acetylmuramate dehydrogenase [Sphaerisporangium sp. NPDC051017]|uniref:UDP-N-acetylmuramate dehydrogenase n=1 Tax=Sphaerisporangium sp. NPDC051017 TaxID=3154636 RepID=UPI003423AB93
MYVRTQVPLAPLTTLGIGGNAAILAELTESSDFPDAVGLARREGVRPLVLGGGSNILVADVGCGVPVVRMATQGAEFEHSEDGETVTVTVQAGHALQDLVEQTVDGGLTGMETLIGIPGTVGATPVQNVGAYGQEVADTLVRVTAWDWATGSEVTLSAEDCRLAHRTSIFKHSTRWTLLTVTFRLRRSNLSTPITYGMVAKVLDVPKGTPVPLSDAAAAVLVVRRSKGMVLDPGDADNRNVGSVFLSPVVNDQQAEKLRAEQAPVNDFPDGLTRVSASWLIKATGFALGQPVAPGIRMSTKHFTLVADGQATASAFAEAARTVADTVQETTGIQLTPEPDLFGDEPAYLRLKQKALGSAAL